MAEKEERILCIETYEKIAECGYGDFYNTITRQEAIERMKESYIKKHIEVMRKEGRRLTDEESFGAMLDGLLEVHK